MTTTITAAVRRQRCSSLWCISSNQLGKRYWTHSARKYSQRLMGCEPRSRCSCHWPLPNTSQKWRERFRPTKYTVRRCRIKLNHNKLTPPQKSVLRTKLRSLKWFLKSQPVYVTKGVHQPLGSGAALQMSPGMNHLFKILTICQDERDCNMYLGKYHMLKWSSVISRA